MKKIIVLLLCIVSLSIPCLASSWYWIGQSHNGMQYYIDNDSVLKNNDYAIIWIKCVKPNGYFTEMQIGITHYYKTYVIKSYITYDNNNNVVDSHTFYNHAYEPIGPDSAGKHIYDYIWNY